jgi:hypothetical protein
MTMLTQPALPTASTPRACHAVGAVSGTPLVLLRLEGGAVLVAATFAYCTLGGRWALFAGSFSCPTSRCSATSAVAKYATRFGDTPPRQRPRARPTLKGTHHDPQEHRFIRRYCASL